MKKMIVMARFSEQPQMIGILRLKRTYQELKFGKLAKISKAGIFQEKRPACETTTNAALQPFKANFWLPCERKNASNLVTRVVGVPKGLRTRTGSGYALECSFESASQCIEDALKANHQRLVRQEV